MIHFPNVPTWWKDSNKFMHLETGFSEPDYILGYDTETYKGHVLTQQFTFSRYGKKERKSEIEWVNDGDILDRFLSFVSRNCRGNCVVFCFNSHFDLAILLRRWIERFLQDDFTVYYKGFEIQVFCSRNWYAFIRNQNVNISFLDVQNYFSGSLDSVSKSFNLQSKKLEKPEGLGDVLYTKRNKHFVEYALMDSRLCLEIGEIILDMHQQFDIPLSSSSANFAEKVFRRQFITGNMKIQYPSDFYCVRMAEESYHGGKNGYYLDSPALVEKCYEYDFNSAYPSAMYSLPSFLSGRFQHVSFYSEKYVGVYQVSGKIQPCIYGVLYDRYFNYYRYHNPEVIKCVVTSFELEEALRHKEFKIDKINGWIWKPSSNENPIGEYAKYFWEKKNSTPKEDVRYLFYKLLLNSLYGKWIQRNPSSPAKYTYTNNELKFIESVDTSGGLYQPFIASLITGYVRAKLHTAEHFFEAIESSTDSVKSKRYVKEHDGISRLGAMQLQIHTCKSCDKKYKAFTGLFVRNRLNVLMDKQKHVLKAALHGYWGKAEELYKMYKEGRVWYQVQKMSGIREGLKQQNKPMFQMHTEERSLNVDWSRLQRMK